MSEIAEAKAPTATVTALRIPRDNAYYETKREIEEFLYDEANLLDERRFKEWLDTLAEDLRYFMPMEHNVKFGEHAARELTKREEHMAWFNEGKWSLGKRAEQILTGVHWAEEPLSRVCRMVSNVQLTAMETNSSGNLEVDVSSRFLIYQNRCEYEQYFFVGDRLDRIRRTADGWRLALREIHIHQNVLLAKNLTVFF
ncbi:MULTISPECIES: 3-phenylpropionate/cinnamic acid dioxygenase subunit beta [unclassified Variovorax]|uniref:3-phenylpropionate/cinnamic acid dioxygenase subunit beta n=1 Tax=unclassified Variovorax TaxID=663243 RepID=UPI00086AF991|nr:MULTISPECIES: 3-phenylpropionate/cinnamic acid dioxygenase subunit beta [unclassified Variovorax]MBN8758476.1 3-phenylpropionate/cinnamic acid dioxygenase subunit beta [Variovorax sp.]ODU18877.1 MAG: 3-phenylpropionate dioxygenase [Variovorax sp. SCN 67-85]ODV18332.1 MAG: 3-phenylpropionate dioxygenase [Variovorax sp. SCN 67-20]OJZ05863.1 MAG: 3-phenylpropionate dioxygenase [Variovorax sp. 67-131]